MIAIYILALVSGLTSFYLFLTRADCRVHCSWPGKEVPAVVKQHYRLMKIWLFVFVVSAVIIISYHV